MKRALLKVLATSAIALTTLVTFTVSPAFAINNVPCRTDGNFLWINNGTSSERDNHCFANAGSVDVAIFGVYVIWAGNNNVAITFIDDLGDSKLVKLIGRNGSWHYDSPGQDRIHEITRIQIL